MKTPPLLLGAALLFWGWQTGHVPAGTAMAAVLEGSRLIKTRWEFTDDDFRRIWIFCALLVLAAALYAFTASGAPSNLRGFFQDPSLASERNAGNASARTVAALIRWLPMIFFLFVTAAAFSSREGVPPETISVILRLRWQRARRLVRPLPAARSVDVSYPYFMLCLLAASFHPSEDETFFWGWCALLAWALWPQRSRRYGVVVWAGAMAAALALGYGGQRGVGRLYRLFDNYNAPWFSRVVGGGADPMQSRTALGQIGRLKASHKIVIRLEPKAGSRAPTLLREASYRTWKGQMWFSEVSRDKFDQPHDLGAAARDHQQRGGQPRLLSARPVRAAAVAGGLRAAGKLIRLGHGQEQPGRRARRGAGVGGVRCPVRTRSHDGFPGQHQRGPLCPAKRSARAPSGD
jgi:hypothetical protein